MNDRIIAIARSWIGTPYRHQSSLKGVGCDCIGLVHGVWREFYDRPAIAVPTYSADWGDVSGNEDLLAAARAHLTEIAIANAAPGDVIVFRWREARQAKHAGLLSAADRFIHAYSKVAVCEVHLVPMWRERIVAAFRFPADQSPRDFRK